MSVSVREICEAFFNLEEKYNLNYQQIQGCYAWQLIRMHLYYDITRKTQIFNAPQQKSLSLADKVKTFLPFFKNSVLKNPFTGKYTRDILIFDHPRKVIFNGEYCDIYSNFLVDFLKEDYSFEVLESPYLNHHYTQKQDYVRYTDAIQLGSYVHKKFNKVKFSQKELDLILKVQDELEKIFNIKLNIRWMLTTHILNFQYDFKKYVELFKKRKPKMIFVVVAYENHAIVAAAKSLGIEVIELQHGTITDYHLGYSYPKKTRLNGEIPYFPDKILSFGDYWMNEDTSPIVRENIIPIGFSYFQKQSKDFIGLESFDKQVLFISQGVIGKYLSGLAFEFAKNQKDLRIIYKLHPGEYETWRQNYPELVEASKFDNFTVIDNSEIPLYKLLAESGYQVGAFSTAIYEGLMFNCKTFILDVPGVEYLDDLIENEYVFKIENVDDLNNNLLGFKPTYYDKNFFFKNLDKKLLKSVIDNG
ncbi:MAG: sialyltransferase [Methanobrevibacter sp.]|uniref:sialyltransferase n=1 Tax=Methanobrevibacter sp. TaxID=66852 RepID=UPI0025FB7169|nr:sialyltransferase [Methanobrevibacter sp.]MBQ8016627.1 sialyltransferase [Methanobrevibacter sp.]